MQLTLFFIGHFSADLIENSFSKNHFHSTILPPSWPNFQAPVPFSGTSILPPFTLFLVSLFRRSRLAIELERMQFPDRRFFDALDFPSSRDALGYVGVRGGFAENETREPSRYDAWGRGQSPHLRQLALPRPPRILRIPTHLAIATFLQKSQHRL